MFNIFAVFWSKLKFHQECKQNWEMKMNDPIVPYPLDSESRKRLIDKGVIIPEKYEFRFMFDYGADSCLWSSNDAAIEKYGVGPVDLFQLNLSTELREELISLCNKHDTVLDWENPLNGLLWSDEECYAFREQARVACWKVINELGSEYGVAFERDLLI